MQAHGHLGGLMGIPTIDHINSGSLWKQVGGSSDEKIELVPYCGWRLKIISKTDTVWTVEYLPRNPFWRIVRLWRRLREWVNRLGRTNVGF